MNRVVCIILFLNVLAFWPATAQEPEQRTDPPTAQADSAAGLGQLADKSLFAALQLIAGELELIRQEMGRPLADAPGITITDAELRNVYFHARALFEKTNRLAFEHTHSKESPPAVPSTEVEEGEVLILLQQIHGQLKGVKRAMFIKEAPLIEQHSEAVDASDLLTQIIRLNKQLNRLLELRFAPRDVYQKVTLSVHTMARILTRFPEARNIPEEPPHIRHKTPTDVFLRLHDARQQLVQICQASNLKIPSLTLDSRDEARIPSDVYDLAVLLETDLRYIHSTLGDLEEPNRVLDPGRKFPSHVYQRVGMLEAQIALLAEKTAADETWTRHE